MRRALIWLIGAALVAAVAVPGAALAQSALAQDDSVLVAVDRDVVVAADEAIGTLVVVSGYATVVGRVQTVVVVDGKLTVEGTVSETVVAVSSDVTLAASAVVDGDVVIASGALTRADGAVIGGSVTRNFDLRLGWALTVISILFWIGITIGLMLAGLALVAIAQRQVRAVGDLLSDAPGRSVLATVILLIALPLAAAAAFVSIIGIPIGLALVIVVLPLLWALGYLVAAERVGRLVLRGGREAETQPSPYIAVLLGVLIFQVGGLVPVLGGLVIALAALYGAGGSALYAWRGWRRGVVSTGATPPPAAEAAAPTA